MMKSLFNWVCLYPILFLVVVWILSQVSRAGAAMVEAVAGLMEIILGGILSVLTAVPLLGCLALIIIVSALCLAVV